ncbi:hypothetical protein VARIO8X_20084 [Burkholderiales bacterium 8X]|nr:hypothetical protein VARIO8X_20084 [Burkholderiales bacterium 8X]
MWAVFLFLEHTNDQSRRQPSGGNLAGVFRGGRRGLQHRPESGGRAEGLGRQDDCAVRLARCVHPDLLRKTRSRLCPALRPAQGSRRRRDLVRERQRCLRDGRLGKGPADRHQGSDAGRWQRHLHAGIGPHARPHRARHGCPEQPVFDAGKGWQGRGAQYRGARQVRSEQCGDPARATQRLTHRGGVVRRAVATNHTYGGTTCQRIGTAADLEIGLEVVRAGDRVVIVGRYLFEAHFRIQPPRRLHVVQGVQQDAAIAGTMGGIQGGLDQASAQSHSPEARPHVEPLDLGGIAVVDAVEGPQRAAAGDFRPATGVQFQDVRGRADAGLGIAFDQRQEQGTSRFRIVSRQASQLFLEVLEAEVDAERGRVRLEDRASCFDFGRPVGPHQDHRRRIRERQRTGRRIRHAR